MPSAIVVGGGLAGLSCAAALGGTGFDVTVLESRPFLGGRATSYPLPGSGGEETIDNCQHILLRCCTNLLDFYHRLGVAEKIEFHKEFYFLQPGGAVSRLAAGLLPAPLHFAGAFLRLRFLSLMDKWAVIQGMGAIRRELHRDDLDGITMMDWLREHGQTPGAIERFWRQVLVSAVNEELDRMSASYGFQVMWLGFLASRSGYEMGVPAVPLADLYESGAWNRMSSVRMEFRTSAERFSFSDNRVTRIHLDGSSREADCYICCLPFERVREVAPELGIDFGDWEHSPITGIHLFFDRPVTSLPHAALLDRTIQWFFNKKDGRYLQLVVSASRDLLDMERAEIIRLAMGELAEFLPQVSEAKLLKSHVVKEVRATFSARPGLEALRPGPVTRFENFFLAGDWTRTGWPATMEGAVRSGYLAAEAVTASLGQARKFLV